MDGRPDEQIAVIAGITITVKVAHVRLCHSRMMFVRACMRESQGRRIRRRSLTRTTGHFPSSTGPARAGSTIARPAQCGSIPTNTRWRRRR